MWNAGPAARPALEAALRRASAKQHGRLERALAVFHSPSDRKYKRFIEFRNDVCLQRFVFVAEILEDHGKLSYPQMARLLEAKITERQLPEYARAGASTLRDSVKRVQKAFNGKALTTASDGTKGTLTPAGKRLLAKAREYLASKQRAGSLAAPSHGVDRS